MNIFNSLGSNYDGHFTLQTLFAQGAGAGEQLKHFLMQKYGGEALVVYKGREALEIGLNLLALQPDSEIAITGFTCYVVYKAVINAHLKPVYIDIGADNLNFTAAALKKTLQTHPKLKAVVIQNTLGYPCDIEKIATLCKQKGIVLIEDLAHCVGAIYENGQEAGTVGDLTILSFSQDKMIDGISGGALLVHNKQWQRRENPPWLKPGKVSSSQQMKDRWYPLFTYLIRKTYGFGVGKILHSVLKQLKLLSQPISSLKDVIHILPDWYSAVTLTQFNNLEKDLAHRRQIATVYQKNLHPNLLFSALNNQAHSSCVRFPIHVSNRQDLIAFLKKYHLYFSDIWFDAPISPKRYFEETNYDHSCPVAEKTATEILNLPTHKNVSLEEAALIAERINQWHTPA